METIQFGKYIELAYEIFVVGESGNVSVYKFDDKHPDRFVFGMDQTMIEGFMKHVQGLEQGQQFDFTLEANEAFGERNTDQVIELDKHIFEVNGEFDTDKVYVGAMVPMMTQDGMRIEGRVINITTDKVTMDFNHQLAGERVRYQGKVLTVRDATAEEMAPKHGTGCSCDGGCDGGCSGCGGGCD